MTIQAPARAPSGSSFDNVRVAPPAPRVPRRGSRFFIWSAVAMLVVVALGFGKSFYLRPVFTDRPLPAYLVMHGGIMTAWYLLFLVQGVLVYRGRSRLHRKVGVAGVVLAAGVIITGALVHLNRVLRVSAESDISNPEGMSAAIRFAIGGLSSLIPFAALIVLALLLRRHSGVHRRLMFWAMVWTLGPAFTSERPLGAVLDSLVAPWLPYFPADLGWLGALVVYDWKSERRIHPATYVTFIALVFFYFVITDLLVGSHTLQQSLMGYVQSR